MISVVIPLYNKETTIQRALQSVLNQTYQDFEIVVVDDGSSDNGVAQVTTIQDTRIRLVRQDNQGVSAARNRGISEANSDWIAFLDADDEWESQLLESFVELSSQHPTCKVISGAYRHVDTSGKWKNIELHNLPFEDSSGILSNYFEVASTSNPPFCSISVMVRKDALLQIGGFPVGVKQGEDLLTWARLAVNNQIAYTIEPLATFYPDRGSYYSKPSRIPAEDDIVGQELEKLLQRHPDIKGLKDYVGHWHKMRASIYLRLPGYNKQSRQEIRKALSYATDGRKLYLYRMLLVLPYNIRMALFKRLG